ncbi:MAG: hypothetical protein E7Z80_03090 [Methanobrevibacter thaueri]|nr:hypothetical protein [Methanobrevibacter thaueri]
MFSLSYSKSSSSSISQSSSSSSSSISSSSMSQSSSSSSSISSSSMSQSSSSSLLILTIPESSLTPLSKSVCCEALIEVAVRNMMSNIMVIFKILLIYFNLSSPHYN